MLQVGKVFACGARLAANLTRTRWDLLYRPLQKAMTKLRTNRAELRSISAEVREVAAPLKQEVQGRDDETEKLREENDYFDAQVGKWRASPEWRVLSKRMAPQRGVWPTRESAGASRLHPGGPRFISVSD